MDRLYLMSTFVAVVDCCGFAGAARKLNVSPPAVTRAIAKLEERLGVQLLTRTTRVVRVTEAGAAYADDCRRILAEVEEADAAASGARSDACRRPAAPIGESAMSYVNKARPAVVALLQEYFDGLHHSDTQCLRRVFHPQAIYATASDGTPLILRMDEYFALVDRRPSPASRGDSRTDHIVSIDFVGPVTALARVQCSILPKHFTDLLALIHADTRWQIIAKVFHHELATDA